MPANAFSSFSSTNTRYGNFMIPSTDRLPVSLLIGKPDAAAAQEKNREKRRKSPKTSRNFVTNLSFLASRFLLGPPCPLPRRLPSNARPGGDPWQRRARG